MKLPLEKRLRKRSHIQLGYLQDELAEILYSVENGFVLHGGTAIWRCYGGARFSEDLDFYLPAMQKTFEGKFRTAIDSRGLQMKKFKATSNLIFCKVSDSETEASVEINFSKKISSVPVQYEKMDGSSMIVLSLSPEALILEKANAYVSRKLIRDIYDVYFLSGKLENVSSVSAELGKQVQKFPAPLDESTLKTLVYSGAVPSFAQMLEYLRRRFP